MSIDSSGNLIDTLRQHRLLSSAQLYELTQIAQGRCGDARQLAKSLVQRGWLTIFQINHILSGNARELVYGPYHVIDRLGQGGLSQVFKARNVDNDILVALKVIRPEVMTNREGRQQFLQEMEAMASLDHPNIVQFCDADQSNDTFYFAMEFVDGTDLGKHVRLSGPLPVREACDYIRQTANGLQHAHERNLIHRDIKPVNLFVTNVALAKAPSAVASASSKPVMQKQIKILDWGLACPRMPQGSASAGAVDNVAKNIVGTADYLSPEQARNANAVDIRGDIYSLGCTLYYLLTGQPPFPEGSLMQKILQHQQAEPAPIDTFRGDVPTAVTAIVKRMLAKKPEERFQTPASVAMALMPFVRKGTTTPPLGSLSTLKGTPPQSNRDDTPLPAALGGVTTSSGYVRLPKAGIPRSGGAATADTASPR
jgi:serine/threonine protein kinase